ncbi:hypothetical protein SDRG_04036 [Saprolegnia diclina VS20]|uniref:Uncharacterized protein n=1 Tax=Saprolegnia diclina (strain VS20) TaxID=1156394 RepID=T0S6E0_SAPDV|nr:hypothetical protein SDRG_04036 [Saprolegnia diclina VS20]EQC38317.1 hypothetical protein SDRG_04036 [Saprolegnia diclina VS20]|eukprot:XP_008607909.1 hypothetical protein SDRG_04036 [Saprolegnia diclina VS20]
MDEVAFPAIDRAKRRFLKRTAPLRFNRRHHSGAGPSDSSEPNDSDAGALLRSLYEALDADLAGRYALPVIDVPALDASYAELLVLLDAPIALPELESCVVAAPSPSTNTENMILRSATTQTPSPAQCAARIQRRFRRYLASALFRGGRAQWQRYVQFQRRPRSPAFTPRGLWSAWQRYVAERRQWQGRASESVVESRDDVLARRAAIKALDGVYGMAKAHDSRQRQRRTFSAWVRWIAIRPCDRN